ncbi:hypothetical protein Tco_0478963 [Tanacetum coccineum]
MSDASLWFDASSSLRCYENSSLAAFKNEKRRTAFQKKAAQATSTNRLSISTNRPFVSTANTPYVSAASTSTCANVGESSFVYLRGKIPIDASTLPNADLPIDPNMPDLEYALDTLPNDGIFNGAYDDVKGSGFFKAMQVELLLFKLQEVWYLLICHMGKEVIKGFDRREGIDNDVFLHTPWPELRQLVNQQPNGIFISQDKYVADILKKFDFLSIRTTTTPIKSNKPLVKDEDVVDVDVHVYRSMISSLMYLTTSRPDIMFVVCACARFQVSPKASHLNAVKRNFRYLKHQPKLGLWYLRDSLFELEAYSDTDYGGASLGKKSITGGCQFLRRRFD